MFMLYFVNANTVYTYYSDVLTFLYQHVFPNSLPSYQHQSFFTEFPAQLSSPFLPESIPPKPLNLIVFQVSTDVFINCVYPSVKEITESGWTQATPETLLISLALQRCWGVCINCIASSVTITIIMNDNHTCSCVMINLIRPVLVKYCGPIQTQETVPAAGGGGGGGGRGGLFPSFKLLPFNIKINK